jgi:hypothetical protein
MWHGVFGFSRKQARRLIIRRGLCAALIGKAAAKKLAG